MSMTRQTILASRPAAMVLALSLVAGLSAPFLMLPRAKAATTPLACSENNNNGCTELSPTPPQDTVAVPPNIVLMLDDSGSMKADYMPDFQYLNNNGDNAALIDAANNGVYYDPTVTYLPPPKADSTTAAPDTYPSQTDMTNIPQDGFGAQNPGVTVNLYTYDGRYECNHSDSCGSGRGRIDFNTSVSVQTGTTTTTVTYDDYASSESSCSSTYSSYGGTGGYQWTSHLSDRRWYLNGHQERYGGECEFSYPQTTPTYTTYNFFQYSTGDADGPYTVHYIAANSSDCANAPDPANCVAAGDTSGTSAPEGVTVGTNVANWFAYYHTRILMAKSGLMSAFLNLSPDYRFGFGSLNGRNDANLPSPTGSYGQNGNDIAQVQPFGDGTSGTRKAAFWNWVATVVPGKSTPLRRSLQAMGEYYKTQQPWTTMSSDPGYTAGSTTKYACRASYAILTTDGFWNGSTPTSPTGISGAAGSDGPTYTPPAGKTYTVTGYVAQAPYSGGASSSGVSLADVATYYWERDLQDGSGSSFNLANEVAPSTQDPAFWQHMTTFTMGMGIDPTGISPSGTTIPQIFAWAQGGSAISGFSWPAPSSDSINNITDLAHAAVNGHGDFFSAKNPQQLAAGFSSAIAQISARNVAPTTAAVNASVVTTGALSFSTGYNTGDWSGSFWAVTINSDGTVSSDAAWKAETSLNSNYHSATGYSNRKVFTDAYTLATDSSGNVTSATFDQGFQFTSANAALLDSIETAGLKSPALAGGSDTLANRINFLLGDPTYEGTVFRSRTSLLGAIIRSQPVYVSFASGGYYDTWPSGSPEIADGVQSYDTFVSDQSTRPGTAYVGANDGMLHAFAAPAPTGCAADGTGCDYGNGGTELWAFIPRAVYANLGNLTSTNFSYRPTVDETPVTRDVFFSEGSSSVKDKWHTILAGGVGLGGRGVYALDITDPTSFSESDVLWEFDSDMTIPSTDDCQSIMGSSADATGCRATDLGYTVSQPNIGRLHNGKWAVLVSNGYFPDCGTPDTPTNDSTNCKAIAAQAPTDASGIPYSALFVLDAQTGSVIAELKTPTDIPGVTSFGLSTPVMGDYDSDQVDDVAFAGDVQGNLWRFDLSDASPANWKVTLVYKGLADASGNQGLQSITTMPRLFPDPATNRFMVVFGTGKFLGIGDNSDNTVQAVMGVRDNGTTYSQADLTEQYLHETTVSTTLPDGSPNPSPLAGATLRCVTGSASDACDTTASAANPIPSTGTGSGGWIINLEATSGGVQTNAGERVVVSPGAIFASNTVVFETLITGSASSDPCSPSTQGAIMVLDATTGGAAGVSSLGGWPYVGGRISNARTSGNLPIVSSLGGGQAYLPGTTLAPSGKTPLSIDAPIWRRRSWNEINEN
jgi:type IV pilus assembly protein PilY1